MFNAPIEDIPAKVYRIKRNSRVQTVLRTGPPTRAVPLLRTMGWSSVSETCTSTAHRLYYDLQKLDSVAMPSTTVILSGGRCGRRSRKTPIIVLLPCRLREFSLDRFRCNSSFWRRARNGGAS